MRAFGASDKCTAFYDRHIGSKNSDGFGRGGGLTVVFTHFPSDSSAHCFEVFEIGLSEVLANIHKDPTG